MRKISIIGLSARDKALKGAGYVAEAVKATIGPFGSNVLIEKGNRITNDGYTISSELCPTVEDEFERRGAIVLHEASAKTNDMVGDATSTAEVLAYEITKEAIRLLPREGSIKAKATPAEVISMIAKAKEEVISKLVAKPIESKEELVKSALVSVENEAVAHLLGETQWELGADGVIVVEEVNETQCSIERVRGIRMDNGMSASIMVNNLEKGTLEVSKFPVLLTNYTMGQEDILALKTNVINHLISQKHNGLILVARAFTPDAIKLMQETMKTGFSILPINAPYTNQAEVMRDIEAVVGGRYIDSEEVRREDIFATDVGFCERIVAGATSSIITGTESTESQERVNKCIEKLEAKLLAEQSDFGKRMLRERIAQLKSGFAILKVGAETVVERKRLKDKCDDAVFSVRLALKGGTIAGGGVALLEVSNSLSEDNILKRPIRAIYDQIIASAPIGWIVPEWVRDPYITITTALTNACSVAGVLCNVNGVITTKDKKYAKEEETD